MPDIADIITLAEAKDFLNITNTTYDDKLGPFITAASQSWVRRVGPVVTVPAYEETYDGGGSTIVLRRTPVIAVVSVTEFYGSTLAYTLTAEPLDGYTGGDAYGYTVDLAQGLIVRRANGDAGIFAPGARNVLVTYTAGYSVVPEDIKFAVKVILRQMWGTQRGGGERPGAQPDQAAPMSLWPAMALAIANNYLVPGIA